MRSTSSVAFGLAVCLIAAGALAAQSPRETLIFADKVRMLNCEPAASAPCFRVKLNAVDAQGAPASLELPPGAQLAGAMTILLDNYQEIVPFYASAEAAGAKNVRGRIALVLIDISGSMNSRLRSGQTRFEAAKAALSQFLENFEDGVDQVAIVPFESHKVEATIRSARFATTKEAAEQEVDSLPVPGRKNNTGLYSAVVIGLDVLQQKVRESGKASAEMSLIIMTDGKNEVYKGDDAGLLDGAAGLETAASKVKDSGIQVIGVGFGAPAEIDETALRQISTRYYMAQDAQKLNTIFTFARKLLQNRITATFSSPWPDRASLSGRVLHVSARLKLASGEILSSNQQTWSSPEMGVPVFDQKCDVAEMSALLGTNKPSPGSDWMPILRPILVFAGLGGLIIILWFWLPRLIWPDRYIGIVPSTQRWMNTMNTQMTRAGAAAPTGFRPSKGGAAPAPRGAADPTVVFPKTEFTKTRLDRDK